MAQLQLLCDIEITPDALPDESTELSNEINHQIYALVETYIHQTGRFM